MSSLIILLCLLLVVIGIVMIACSRPRGRPHPACGSCGYDVTGSVGRTETCPECGSSFLNVGVLPPRRVGRPRLLFAGLIIVVLGVLVIGAGLTASAAAVARAKAERARAAAAQAIAAQAPPMQDEGEADADDN